MIRNYMQWADSMIYTFNKMKASRFNLTTQEENAFLQPIRTVDIFNSENFKTSFGIEPSSQYGINTKRVNIEYWLHSEILSRNMSNTWQSINPCHAEFIKINLYFL